MDSPLKGKRAIGWLRCSTDQQRETSIADQQAIEQNFAGDHGIDLHDFMRLEGISASVAKNLDMATQQVIARKLEKQDFDIVLIYDHTRFSRTGSRHASKLLYELETHGIEVVPVLGYQPRHAFSDVVDSFNYAAAREQTVNLASNVARGAQSSLVQGRKVSCVNTPYGLDKLILTADGRPLHVLRNRGSLQQRLHPETGEEMERTFVDSDGIVRGRWHKDRDQFTRLIPGEPKAQEVVKSIFNWYYMDGLGLREIAKRLNDAGVPSPRDNLWSFAAVRYIVLNSVYLGYTFGNRTTAAIYYCCSVKEPIRLLDVPVTASGEPKLRVRPRSDWIRTEHPALAEFLPKEVRERATAKQEAIWEKRKDGHTPRNIKHRHRDSEFLLTGLLECAQGGMMTGRRKNERVRQYRAPRLHYTPRSGMPVRHVRAEPLEQFVVEKVSEFLKGMPGLREAVLAESELWQKTLHQDNERDGLERELAKIARRINFIDSQLDEIGEEAARAKMSALSARRREIEASLNARTDWQPLSKGEMEGAIDSLLDGLSELGRRLGDLPNADIKKILKVIVASGVIDVQARQATFVFRVPSWAAVQRGGGLESRAVQSPGLQAPSLFFAERTISFPIPKAEFKRNRIRGRFAKEGSTNA